MKGFPNNLFAPVPTNAEPETTVIELPTQQRNGVDVMSSVDLAKLCIGDTKDAHSDFMKKAKKVLGEGVGNFSDTYLSKQGKQLQCLMLPEREACLMAMSYSYELQAAVYDAWQALRNKPMTQLEMLAQMANEMVRVEQQSSKALAISHQTQNQLAETNKRVDTLFKHGSYTNGLMPSHISIKTAHVRYGYEVVSYEKFKALALHILGSLPVYIYRNHSGIECDSYQILESDAIRLAGMISRNAVKRRKNTWAYPGFPSGFQMNR